MDIWESYEALPALERVIITITITALLVFAVYRIDRWAKKRRRVNSGFAEMGATPKPFIYSNLEHQTDGTLVAYIAYWRFLVFGLFFAAGFYFSLKGFLYFYQELPPVFWRNWGKEASITCVFLLIALAMPFLGVNFLKSGFKKIQLEITADHVRFLRNGIRGGILLSESYDDILYKEIISIRLRQNPFGGGIIDIRGASRTYAIILLLPIAEQEICYRKLDDAIKKYQSKI